LPAEQESQPKTNPGIKRLASLSHVSIAPAFLLLQHSRLRPLIIQAYCVGNAAKGPKLNGFNWLRSVSRKSISLCVAALARSGKLTAETPAM
jgi:hypothetical protein